MSTTIGTILLYHIGVKSAGRRRTRGRRDDFFSATEGARAVSFGRLSDGDPVTRARRCAVPNTLGSARRPRHAAPDPARNSLFRNDKNVMYAARRCCCCWRRPPAITSHTFPYGGGGGGRLYTRTYVHRVISNVYIYIWVYVRTIRRHAPAGRCPVRNAARTKCRQTIYTNTLYVGEGWTRERARDVYE